MFVLALLIGLYSYLIFILGLFHLLYPHSILLASLAYFLSAIILTRKLGIKFKPAKISFGTSVVVIILAQILVNLVGALGPEIAFDALWYHLTLPKLYLTEHQIYHITGSLLYYSDMPKLMEMLYVSALSFGNEITAKVLHWVFGILSCIALYKLAIKYCSQRFALIAVLIFYSNLVVGWISITAYNDLTRTFFEICTLLFFLEWWEKKKLVSLMQSAVMVGFAITTKLLAAGSLIIFAILIGVFVYQHKSSMKQLLKYKSIFIGISLLIPLPWLIFSFIHTGNPIYPIFSTTFAGINAKVFDVNLLNPLHFVATTWVSFTQANDPISPVYMIFIPLLILFYSKIAGKTKIILLYFLLAFLFWYTTSQVEGTRLLVPYLPALSILCAAVLEYIFTHQKQYGAYLFRFILFLIVFSSLISVGYRAAANSKFIPVTLGNQTKDAFLTENLNFSFGDFYDTDGYFGKHIKASDKVLLYGFHNLYYMDFPFIDSSWVRKGDLFNYVATQKTELPKRFQNWQLIYTNDKTMVKLYKVPKDGACDKKCIY